MKDDFSKFVYVLCKLYDGEHPVSHERIKRKWPGCPSHDVIIRFDSSKYFEYHNGGYIPTADGAQLAKNFRESRTNSRVMWATLVIAFLTLLISAVQLVF